tara:strand:+ start:156 stop:419 length:264 start_codon:yes stop_codon:yes gene_type:complete
MSGKQTKNKLPKWFKGTIYEIGDIVTNPFSGERYELNAEELSMYDLIMGITIMGDIKGWNDEYIDLHQKGLSWFREHNSKAYMVLLD